MFPLRKSCRKLKEKAVNINISPSITFLSFAQIISILLAIFCQFFLKKGLPFRFPDMRDGLFG